MSLSMHVPLRSVYSIFQPNSLKKAKLNYDIPGSSYHKSWRSSWMQEKWLLLAPHNWRWPRWFAHIEIYGAFVYSVRFYMLKFLAWCEFLWLVSKPQKIGSWDRRAACPLITSTVAGASQIIQAPIVRVCFIYPIEVVNNIGTKWVRILRIHCSKENQNNKGTLTDEIGNVFF